MGKKRMNVLEQFLRTNSLTKKNYFITLEIVFANFCAGDFKDENHLQPLHISQVTNPWIETGPISLTTSHLCLLSIYLQINFFLGLFYLVVMILHRLEFYKWSY